MVRSLGVVAALVLLTACNHWEPTTLDVVRERLTAAEARAAAGEAPAPVTVRFSTSSEPERLELVVTGLDATWLSGTHRSPAREAARFELQGILGLELHVIDNTSRDWGIACAIFSLVVGAVGGIAAIALSENPIDIPAGGP